MHRILLLGAGRSTASLISFLLTNAAAQNWHLTIGDLSTHHLEGYQAQHPEHLALLPFDINQPTNLAALVEAADVVISMLPAAFHLPVAQACVRHRRPLVTASYVSPEIAALDAAARAAGVPLLMECGLDPGLDHLSAMQVIDRLRAAGAEITSFKSYCGGLVAPESDTNPWHYKFTWNPRNVVVAGQATAKYLQDGAYRYVPYQQLFKRTETIAVPGYGEFEGYPNRDSLSYRAPYGLDHIPTILRGTLRRPGYARAWDALVQLGLTEDTYVVEDSERLTYRQWLESYLPVEWEGATAPAARLARFLGLDDANHEVIEKIAWAGLLADDVIGLPNATPAQILEKRLTEKWSLAPGDRDMVVMQHLFTYRAAGEEQERHLTSSLVVIGDDPVNTAMAKTVGLPVGLVVRRLLGGLIGRTGGVIPTTPDLYEPLLAELAAEHGITFVEAEQTPSLRNVGEKSG
ncbi:MAG: saccharopine dehydrogenase NADP-binding domain-containing protein [Hymenobacteraceae bacterium]|nr:saccharopine dehydrogenase NADP-binding domain-containing protein [Hymenobacteraceae bacterium]